MGLITIQPIGQSTFRLSMARGLQHISNMLKSLIEVPGERIFPKARIGDLPVFGGQRLRTTGESTVNHTDMMVTFHLVQKTTPTAKGVREKLDEMETIQHMFRIREDMCDGLRHCRCKVTDDRTDVSGYALECSRDGRDVPSRDNGQEPTTLRIEGDCRIVMSFSCGELVDEDVCRMLLCLY